jgi:hypothetical protein
MDATVSKNSRRSASAAVARDEGGIFLGASALVVERNTDAEVVKTIACREGLALASDVGLQAARLASDCANAVRSIQDEGMGRYGAIVLEIKSRMENFSRIDFIFERQSSNIDAHLLARSSINLPVGKHVWFLAPLDGICNYISLNE